MRATMFDMISKNTEVCEKLAHAVNEAGGALYYVGGCVRDKLLGIQSYDIDVEVHGISPEALENILSRLGHTRKLGLSFGIWSLDGRNIDIAMPRLEKATGHGHRDFETFIDPFLGTKKASQRRDFTVNAIMENVLTHEIVDHFDGISHLKQGVLKHVDSESFAEDPLRVLRGAGFAARFGFTVAHETAELFKRMSLEELSRERVFAELEKALMKAERPSVFFNVLKETGMLHTWFSEIESLIGVAQPVKYHAEGDAYNHTMLVLDQAAMLRSDAKKPLYFMLSALCHDLGKAVTTREIDGKIRSLMHETEGVKIAEKFITRITGEQELKRYVLNMILLHMRPNMLAGQQSGQKAYFRLFDKSVEPSDLLLLAKADFNGSVSKEKDGYGQVEECLRDALYEYKQLMKREHVTGDDLISAGLSPGKEFSELLALAHKLRLAGVEKKDALSQVLAKAKKQ